MYLSICWGLKTSTNEALTEKTCVKIFPFDLHFASHKNLQLFCHKKALFMLGIFQIIKVLLVFTVQKTCPN